MTATEMYRVLDEIDKRLAKQDKLIAMLESQIRDLYGRLKK
jgi:uncharacterized coiled-coil protein SlyX